MLQRFQYNDVGSAIETVALLDVGYPAVVGGANSVEVTGKVKVNVLHRNYLGISAARSALLTPKTGPKGSEGQHMADSTAVKASARPTGVVVFLPRPLIAIMAVTAQVWPRRLICQSSASSLPYSDHKAPEGPNSHATKDVTRWSNLDNGFNLRHVV